MFDELRDELIASGARHFVDLPVELAFFDELFEHTETLDGVEVTDFRADGIIEMWLQFEFRGHIFFVNNEYTDYQFFVADPECPDEILLEIVEHYRKLAEQ